MTCKTSAVAVCCSNASRVSVMRRAFSIAMTAWAAKFCNSAICLSVKGRWDADALRDVVRDYALEHLAADDAVLEVDETGFLKQGKASCGVARQYTGSWAFSHRA